MGTSKTRRVAGFGVGFGLIAAAVAWWLRSRSSSAQTMPEETTE